MNTKEEALSSINKKYDELCEDIGEMQERNIKLEQ